MKKLFYIIGPLLVGSILSVATFTGLRHVFSTADAVSIAHTYVNGAVLTATQLNSNNTAIYNAFNAHTHDGSQGEASTLSDDIFAGITTPNVIIGSGASTGTGSSAPGITVNSNTGDSRLSLKVNNATANQWDIYNDNSNSDILTFDYNGSNIMTVGNNTNPELEIKNPSNGATELLITSTGGASDDVVLALRVNNTSANQWTQTLDNSESDSLEFSYAGGAAVDFSTGGGIATAGNGVTSNAIAWKVYTGTTCSYSGGSSCTTTIESSFPTSNAPLSFSCVVDRASGNSEDVINGQTQEAIDGASNCSYLYYDNSLDDIVLSLSGLLSCSALYPSSAYRCVAFYTP